MLIGIDASRTTVAQRTGTEAYSLHLIRRLVALRSEHTFRLYFRDSPPSDLFPATTGVDVRVLRLPRLWTHVRLAWEVRRHPPDVLFVPAHALPLAHPKRSVVTVHDLGYLHFPRAHPTAQRLYLDWSTRYSARHARRVLADSRATRDDLVRHYRIPSEKIVVVYPGRDESLAPVADPRRLESVRARYRLPHRFLLHVGSLHPRKNLERLVEAFARVRQRHADVGLVLAGRRGWQAESLMARVRQLGLVAAVRFLEYVPQEDLGALYSAATLYVCPSLYEGFGLPPLEAMACGTPVICSNTSSLPEVVGEAARLISPTDSDAWAVACLDWLDDAEARRRASKLGLEQARKFSWDRCARETVAVLEAVGRG